MTMPMSDRGPRALAAGVALVAALVAGPLQAAQPIPLAAGTYCGPNGAKIIVDVAKDQVTIDNMVCSFPVIAADHLQSDLCSTPQGQSITESFDFRVVGRDFVHGGAWYRLCGGVPSGG